MTCRPEPGTRSARSFCSTRFADKRERPDDPGRAADFAEHEGHQQDTGQPQRDPADPGNRDRDHPGEESHRRADADGDVAEVGGAFDGVAKEIAAPRGSWRDGTGRRPGRRTRAPGRRRAAGRCRRGARGCSCTRSRPESSGSRAACRPRRAWTRRRGRSRARSCPSRSAPDVASPMRCAPSQSWPDRCRRSGARRSPRGSWTAWGRGSAAPRESRRPGRRRGADVGAPARACRTTRCCAR